MSLLTDGNHTVSTAPTAPGRTLLHPMSKARRGPAIAAAFSVLCTLGWAVPAILMANRGFSFTDEGLYLLTYSTWDQNPYFFSGNQYIFGPLFELFHETVWPMRVFRLLFGITLHVVFGLTFAKWLVLRRGAELARWRLAMVLAVTAAAGMSYLWAPLTPGYYQVTAWGALAQATLVVAAAHRFGAGRSIPIWHTCLLGVITVPVVLTKWPTIAVSTLCIGVVLWWVRRGGLLQVLRHLLSLATGAITAVLILALIGVRLLEVVPVMSEVTAVASSAAHSPAAVALHYLDELWRFGGSTVLLASPLLVAIGVGRRVHSWRGLRWWTALIAGCCSAFVVLSTVYLRGWHGGKQSALEAAGVVFALLLAMTLAVVLGSTARAKRSMHETRSTERPIICVLILAPLLQGAGTLAPLSYVSLDALALWIAVALILLTRDFARAHLQTTAFTALGAVLLLAGTVGGTGTLLEPFDTAGYSENTAPIPNSGGLMAAPDKVQEWNAVRSALAPYLGSPPTPMFGVDELAGLIYLLDGVAVGPQWTDDHMPGETPLVLALACSQGAVNPIRPPILLLNRKMDAATADALRSCGFDYPSGYKELSISGGPPKLKVFVPHAG